MVGHYHPGLTLSRLAPFFMLTHRESQETHKVGLSVGGLGFVSLSHHSHPFLAFS